MSPDSPIPGSSTSESEEEIHYVYLDEDGNEIPEPSTAEIDAAVLHPDEPGDAPFVDARSEAPAVHREVHPGGTTDSTAPGGRPRKATKPDKATRRAMPKRERTVAFCRRHRIITGITIVLLPFMLFLSFTFVRALTKPGQESREARVVQWARDNGMGFMIDKVEDKYYEGNQPVSGGKPVQGIGPAIGGGGPITTSPSVTQPGASPTTAKAVRPHTTLPQKMATPAKDPLPQEGEWFPAGPDLGDGLRGVYTTKVRPNAEKTSLLVFVAWVDPKLTDVKLYPGAELPGGQWSVPNFVTPELCPNLIMAGNGGFRFEIPNTGYYSEGREAIKLKDGAASLVLKNDGTVDVVKWGRELGAADLGQITSVRQNLQILVDDGKPADNIDTADWGALLKNSYFVWRSAWGVTKDGALVYAGGPGLTPRNLADTMVNAGAVRALEFDINPEWVTGNLYTTGPDGKCVGTKGLEGGIDIGGMSKSADRYLSLDTRDFVAVFAKKP